MGRASNARRHSSSGTAGFPTVCAADGPADGDPGSSSRDRVRERVNRIEEEINQQRRQIQSQRETIRNQRLSLEQQQQAADGRPTFGGDLPGACCSGGAPDTRGGLPRTRATQVVGAVRRASFPLY